MWSFFSRDPAKGFPYEVGEKISGLESDQSIWSLHDGKQKSNGQPVSVFTYDVTSHNETVRQTAQASVKRLKTLRHPNVLTFVDSLETDKCIYMVTEKVVPLHLHLKENEKDAEMKEVAVSWGLHQIVKGLSFLLNTVNLIHNNVCMSSMFVDVAGEWKLGGVDYMYPASGEGSNVPPIKTLPSLEKYDSPEKTNSSGRSKKTTKWSADMWGLGCLIWESFNGNLPKTSSLKVIGKIPKSLVRHYCELVSANPVSRPSPDKFLENCKMPDCFMSNHFVQTNLFLEEIQIKEPHEQSMFFNDLTKHLDSFPGDYSKHKILPQLLNVFQFGHGGPAVLPPLFKLGKLLDTAEYQAQIVPCVVKLFTSTDRATRIHLLRQLPLFVEHLQSAVVNAQVFPNMVTGFMDTNPAIREQSVKGMLLLAPKLNDSNLNNELMKHFARLQSRDDQGPIRTNTTVCLGKMVPFLNQMTRCKVISSAFARAMKDPFPAARIAGVLAMCNTVQYFNTLDCATKALPALCALTVDPDKQVRDNAFSTIKVFLEKLQKASDDPEEGTKINEAASSASIASNAAAGWTGWMTTGVSSLTSKLYTSKTSPNAALSVGDTKDINKGVKVMGPQEKPKIPDKSQEKLMKSADVTDEPSEENGWEDEEWNSIKDFGFSEENFDLNEDERRQSKTSYKQKKLVTLRQLKAMEDDIWHDLHNSVDKKEVTEEVEDKQDEEACDGWDDGSWNNLTPEEDEDNKSDVWGGGWEEEASWGNTNVKASTKSKKSTSPPAQLDNSFKFAATSSYNWAQEAKATEESFFNELNSKPKKPLAQRNTKSTKVAASSKSTVVKKPAVQLEDDNWGVSDWGASGWGDDEPEITGLSKAERLKLEREEKRKLRQKQLQEKRAAKATGKLGVRKCD